MKCSFCGHTYDNPREKCANCPLNRGCKATCCPNCGYELERESKLADMAKRIFKKVRASGE